MDPFLFLELQELILECLTYDFSCLLKCRLVCRNWNDFSRPRLFKKVDLCSGVNTKRRKRLQGFADLFNAHTSPTFALCIQHITLNDEPRAEDIQALPAGSLKNLRSLCVKSEFALSPSYFKAVNTQFPAITQLDITSIPFMMRRTLLDFICSFENLEWLALGDPRWLGFWMDAHHSIKVNRWKLPPIKTLRLSLDLGSILEKTFLGWLLEQLEQRNTLRVLEYRERIGNPDANQTLLSCVSPSLEVLSIDTELSLTLSVLKAPKCKFLRLTTLRLGVGIEEAHISRSGNLHFGDFPATDYTHMVPQASLDLVCVSNIVEALSRIDAPQIQQLTFKFFAQPDAGEFDQYPCSLGILQYVHFAKLDEVLSQSPNPFPHLLTVTFICGRALTSPCVEYLVVPSKDGLLKYIASLGPGDGVSSQRQASTFLASAFPRTLARNSARIEAVELL